MDDGEPPHEEGLEVAQRPGYSEGLDLSTRRVSIDGRAEAALAAETDPLLSAEAVGKLIKVWGCM